jgi:hypothetical protein
VATRWYFPATASNTSGLTPSFDAGWNYTTEAARADIAKTKGSSAITAGTLIGAWTATAGQTALDRQFISPALAAQTISGTFSLMLMVREGAGTDNVDRIITGLYVVDSSGTKVHTLKARGNSGTTLEFVANATHRTHTGANAAALTSYACAAGDRIVVEIGYSNSTSATTPEASAKWGENATDATLGDNATTADRAGWIEFSANLAYAPVAASTSPDTWTLASVAATLAVSVATTLASVAGTSLAPTVEINSSGVSVATSPETLAIGAVAPGLASSLAHAPSTLTGVGLSPGLRGETSPPVQSLTWSVVAPGVGGAVQFATTLDTWALAALGPSAVAVLSVAPSTQAGATVLPSLGASKTLSPDAMAWAGVSPNLTAAKSHAPDLVTASALAPGLVSVSAATPETWASIAIAPSAAVSGPVSVSTSPAGFTYSASPTALGTWASIAPSSVSLSSVGVAQATATVPALALWPLGAVQPAFENGAADASPPKGREGATRLTCPHESKAVLRDTDAAIVVISNLGKILR